MNLIYDTMLSYKNPGTVYPVQEILFFISIFPVYFFC